MNMVRKINAGMLALTIGASLVSISATAAPASARPQCASNANLWHVHRRLDGAIDQLQHDARDYDGDRVAAI
jgi:hypothetical protein